jgi:hypothetical protein
MMNYSDNYVGDLPIPHGASKWLQDAAATAARRPTAEVLREAHELVRLLQARLDQLPSTAQHS